MTQVRKRQAKELESILTALPSESIEELLDFARSLRRLHTSQLQRGSAAAILHVLEDDGLLHFEEDELDVLLDEIEALRQLDLSSNG